MQSKMNHRSGINDNLAAGITIDFDQLVEASGLDEDALLQQLAETLSKRDDDRQEAHSLPAGGMQWHQRIENYNRVTGFPPSLFIAGDGRVVGTWIMGNDYRVKSGYYGGYPAGYLRRVAALFPDRRRVLHIFSGKVDLATMPGDTVDCNPAMEPTWLANAHDLRTVPLADYDLVLADPPYSIEDAERYQTTMVKRNVVMRSLAHGMSEGSRVVWLDQVLPMYRKDEWAIEAVIGMVKSTNHRFRMVIVFRKLNTNANG